MRYDLKFIPLLQSGTDITQRQAHACEPIINNSAISAARMACPLAFLTIETVAISALMLSVKIVTIIAWLLSFNLWV